MIAGIDEMHGINGRSFVASARDERDSRRNCVVAKPAIGSRYKSVAGLTPTMREIVLGLHWSPPTARAGQPPADLDALCVLCDSAGQVLEVIAPNHPRSLDGSVVHTGDSRTGASTWDDERIFVFLDALPTSVYRLVFVVVSAAGHSFDEVPGAVCHVSDRASEAEWVRVDLTSLLGCVDCVVATVTREPSGWQLVTELRTVAEALPIEAQAQLARTKFSEAPRAGNTRNER